MQIDLSELSSVRGMKKTVSTTIEKEEIRFNGSVYAFYGPSSVSLELEHSKDGIVMVTGTASFQLSIPCDRCLEPVHVPFSLKLEQTINTSASEEERIQALDAQPFIQGHLLDTDLLVCDELVVNMPVKVLCRPDCKGICPKCGCSRNIRDCGCDLFEPDPRMSAIRDLFQSSFDSSGKGKK